MGRIRIIRKAILVALFVFFGTLFPQAHTSYAATTVPTLMNFQGRLTDSSGNIKANGTYNMRFRIYNASTGGTLLWSEDRLVASSQGVTVTNGLFSVQLGSVTSLPASVFSAASTYFEIELPTPATATTSSPSWTEGAMTRSQIATSAYAYNADTLDGLDSTSFAPATGSTNYAPISGSANYIQNGTSAQTASFNVSGTGTVAGNFTNNGSALFYNSTNSASAFTIQTSTASKLFVADTTASRVYIGNPTADATGIVLVLDNSTAEPTGTNGAEYYNSTNNRFRCYQASAWQDCAHNRVSMTADVTNNNATANTLATATGLSFAVTSGTKYQFDCTIWYTAAATTTGSRWTLTGPTATTIVYTSHYTLTATTETANYATAYSTPSASNASSLTAGNIAKITGYLVPSASGTLSVQFASEVASSAIVAKAGSSCEYWAP